MRQCEPSCEDEHARQYRVVDQMLTMHSLYRDILSRRAFWLNTTLVALSLVLAVFSFVEDSLLRVLGFEPEVTRFVVGGLAVGVLIVAITEFRVDWQSVAGRHADAARRLAEMKALYRQYKTREKLGDSDVEPKLADEYHRLMEMLPAIPDRWFNRLKANHCYKVALSKRVSQYPTTPVWMMRLMLRVEGIREVFKGG